MNMLRLGGTREELAGMPDIGNTHTLPYNENDPNTWRRLPLPLPKVTVPAGGVATAKVQPQFTFKVVKINIPTPFVTTTYGSPVVAAAVAPVAGLYVKNILVGQQPQLVASGLIDVRAFSPDAVSSYLDFDTGAVGNTFEIEFQNDTGSPIDVAPEVICLIAKRG
ncbi:MAG: hypothetical protein KIT41_14265 [Pyrinomonadaceae bacterium]|nr:hypothetical protein [Pyrinomonadaceae bacterium]